jgi:RecA-family ATPase
MGTSEGAVALHAAVDDPTSPFEKYGYDAFEKLAAKPVDWLLDGLIPAVGVTLIAGDALVGKSRLMAGLIAARSKPADGDHLAGIKVKPGRSALLSLEHSIGSVANVLRAARLGRSLKTLDLNVYRNKPPVDLMNPLREAELTDELERDCVSLLIIDSIRRVSLFKENSSDEVSAVLTVLNRIAADRMAVIFLHHKTKNTNSPRGSGDFSAGSDSIITISRKQHERILTIYADPHDGEAGQVLLYPAHIGETLTFTQAEAGGDQEETVQGSVLAFVRANAECGTRAVQEGVTGEWKTIAKALHELLAMGAIVNTGTDKRPKWSATT